VMAEPLPPQLPEDAAGPSGEVWWLIVTAAVLALGIALVLLIRF
jgi:predicted cobalt transporter CbtA